MIPLINESWMPVVGFESHYAVSSTGRVMRTAKGGAAQPGKIRALTKDADGYLRVSLCMNGITYPKKAHRLVAEAFLGGLTDGLTVNHKDGNKQNNAINNLEIVTRSENIAHSFQVIKTHSHVGGKNPRCKLTRECVKEIRLLLSRGIPQIKIASMFECSKHAVFDIAHGRSWVAQ